MSKEVRPLDVKDIEYLKENGIDYNTTKPNKPLDIEVTDMLGRELKPGDIIAFPSGSNLKFAVFAGIQILNRTTEYYDHAYISRYGYRGGYRTRKYIDLAPVTYTCTRKDKKKKNIRKKDWDRESGSFECAIRVDNPVFHIDKGGISGCFIVRDELLDDGIIKKEDLMRD